MELKDFVSQTIKQLIDGILEAQEYAKDKNALINPSIEVMGGPHGKSYLLDAYSREMVNEISFEVGLTVTEGSTTDSGAKIGVASFLSVNGGKEVVSSTVNLNKISFSIPIALPQQLKNS